MASLPPDLARRYGVEDFPSARTPGTRLSNILELLEKRRPLTPASQVFLAERGLLSLAALANGEIGEEEFLVLARGEREAREDAKPADREVCVAGAQSESDAADAREAAMWAEVEARRTAREGGPKFIARRQSRELRLKYGVGEFVEEHHFRRLMEVLRKLEAQTRLSAEEVLWLKTEASNYDTREIDVAHHRLEAAWHLEEYHRSRDVWRALSASKHLRKCEASSEAYGLLMSIPVTQLRPLKLKAALLTTLGGAMRDLALHSDAVKCGEEAHSLRPSDYRPCTLMGALNIELGNLELAHKWYQMAEDRGAQPAAIDSELRLLLARMSPEGRNAALARLLQLDAYRYGSLRPRN